MVLNAKAGSSHKRAELLKKMGKDAAALAEMEKAPFDAEIEDHWPLVVDAKFFRLYLMAEAGLRISPESIGGIADDYISLMPTGERVSKNTDRAFQALIEFATRKIVVSRTHASAFVISRLLRQSQIDLAISSHIHGGNR